MITHHVEEIPRGFTHVLLLKEGRVVSAGELEQNLSGETLSEAFALPLSLSRSEGRWHCRAR
jgi:iron complex transport system ATP-binding protein